jgi:hypothetical protein
MTDMNPEPPTHGGEAATKQIFRSFMVSKLLEAASLCDELADWGAGPIERWQLRGSARFLRRAVAVVKGKYRTAEHRSPGAAVVKEWT